MQMPVSQDDLIGCVAVKAEELMVSSRRLLSNYSTALMFPFDIVDFKQSVPVVKVKHKSNVYSNWS